MARTLYRQPQLLVIDESTSHLDATHEAAVTDAIGQLGITRIIVAHRKETIASADHVFTLQDKNLCIIILPPPHQFMIYCCWGVRNDRVEEYIYVIYGK